MCRRCKICIEFGKNCTWFIKICLGFEIIICVGFGTDTCVGFGIVTCVGSGIIWLAELEGEVHEMFKIAVSCVSSSLITVCASNVIEASKILSNDKVPICF